MFAFFDCNDYQVISLKCQPERIDPHTAPDDLLKELTRNSYSIVKAKYTRPKRIR